jgi:ornithine cyclodeaminase/alanine dehydrogenase-like protein (mu-crystallin family)
VTDPRAALAGADIICCATNAMTDPQFIVAAKQANMYINPMGGEELQAMVEKIAGPPERILMLLRQATEFKGRQE